MATLKSPYDYSKMTPIRSALGGLGQIQWNGNQPVGQRTIGVGGMTLREGQDFQINPEDNKAYADTAKLGLSLGAYGNKPLSDADLQPFMGTANSIADNFFNPRKAALDTKSKELEARAAALRRGAETAYTEANSNLKRQEGQSQLNTVHNIGARNLDASPISAYLQAKTSESYRPLYQNIESQRATQVANANDAAALGLESLGNDYAMLEADRGDKAYNMALDLAKQNKQGYLSYSDMLMNQEQQQYNRDQQSKEWDNKLSQQELSNTRYDQEWQNKISQQEQEWPLEKALKQAQIENTLRSANAPYTTGTSDSKGSNQWDKLDPNTKDFIMNINKFNDPNKAMNFLNSNSIGAGQSGVNLMLVLEFMKMKWPQQFAANKGSSSGGQMTQSEVDEVYRAGGN